MKTLVQAIVIALQFFDQMHEWFYEINVVPMGSLTAVSLSAATSGIISFVGIVHVFYVHLTVTAYSLNVHPTCSYRW